MPSSHNNEDKFLYHLFRLIILWVIGLIAIGLNSKDEIETFVTNYIAERVNHEQPIQHDAQRSQEHNI